MSEDLTNKLRPSTDDNVWLILKAVQDLTFRAGMSEQKFEDFAEKLDRRLNNTDSILDKVVADIAHLQEGHRSGTFRSAKGTCGTFFSSILQQCGQCRR